MSRPIRVRRGSWAAAVAIVVVLAVVGAALWDGVIPRGIGIPSAQDPVPESPLVLPDPCVELAATAPTASPEPQAGSATIGVPASDTGPGPAAPVDSPSPIDGEPAGSPSVEASAVPSPMPSASDSSEPTANPSETTSTSPSPTPAPSATTRCPGVPTDLRVSVGDNRVEIAWTYAAPAGADDATLTDIFIRVNRVDGSQGETPTDPDAPDSDERLVRVDPLQTSAVIDGLRNGVRYGLRVIATNAYGRGQASEPMRAEPTSGAKGEVAGLVVRFESGTSVLDGQEIVPGEAAVSEVDLRVDDRLVTGLTRVELSEPVTAAQARAIAADVQSDPRVASAEPDILFSTSAQGMATPVPTPNDPQYAPEQWNLWGLFGVGVGEGPEVMTDALANGQGRNVTIAVIDTGITAHPDLDAQVLDGRDFVSDPVGMAAARVVGGDPVSFDTDGDPGWDAYPADPGDWRETSPARTSTWHGTAVAGVIAARMNNALGIVGMAPQSKILPIRAIGWRGGLLSDLASAIAWAAGVPVDGVPANVTPASVINLSLAAKTACPVSLQAAIDAAIGRGAVVVAAAGNANANAADYAPGNCNGVLTVAATGRDGLRSPYSNFGSRVDLAAPGGDGTAGGQVTSTSNDGVRNPANPTYAAVVGTSIAAAHVSAAVATFMAAGDTSASIRSRLASQNVPFARGADCDIDPSKGCGLGIVSIATPRLVDPSASPTPSASDSASAGDMAGPSATPSDTLQPSEAALSASPEPLSPSASPSDVVSEEPLVQAQAACTPTTSTTGVYTVVTFTATGSCDWTVPSGVTNVEYVMVAGGGGGGGNSATGSLAGGGGGGGVKNGVLTLTSGATTTITVGTGGTAGAYGSRGGNGGGSAIGTTTTTGGGGGATPGLTGSNGGSGGGGGFNRTAGGTGVTSEGYRGETPGFSTSGGGGGGGAEPGGFTNYGNGGRGRSSQITGSWSAYGGGGGGYYSASTTGGSGGGGKPALTVGGTATAGTDGLGGGGGAGYGGVGAKGGSGIVIIRYVSATCTPVNTMGGHNRVVRFQNGTCSWTVPPSITSVNYLVVGGGGGGGAGAGAVADSVSTAGGGGGGGVLSGTKVVTPGTVFTITAGPGGLPAGWGSYGGTGWPSTFAEFTAKGGGGGASAGGFAGLSGGSGGGGSSTGAGGAGTAGQGFAGATPIANQGGGGGGAGEAGNTDGAGQGGDGTASSITGTSTIYGGGGGGAVVGGAGGAGGGGNPGTTQYGGGVGGTDGLGGGGGGGFTSSGGRGGSGIVMLSYPAVFSIDLSTAPVGGAAGGLLATQPVVRMLDSYGAVVTDDSFTQVTVTVNNGGILGGTVTRTAVNGIVTFTDLTLGNIAGTNYTLTFTTNAPTPKSVAATTTVTNAVATQLVFTIQPSSTNEAGTPFAAQPVIQIRDQYGNLVTTGADATRTIALVRLGGTGTLLGTTSLTAVAGVATFSGLNMTLAGTGKTIQATTTATGGALSVTSTSFTITAAAASTATSTVTAATSPITANGTSTSAITVQLKDQYGNNVTVGSNTVALSTTLGSLGLVTNNGNGTYSATLTSGLVAGTAVISATLNGAAVTSTASVVMNPGTATGIDVIGGTGLTATVGTVVNSSGTLKLKVVDANGNIRPGDQVTVTVLSGGGSLAGAPVTLTMGSDGMAVVPAWTLGTTAGANSLRATLVGNSSITATINATGTAGAVTGATVTYSGGFSALSTQAMTSGTGVLLRVAMVDSYGNVNPNWTGTVTLSSTAYAGTITATITSAGLVDSVSMMPTIAGTSRVITLTAVGSGGAPSLTSAVTGASGFTVNAGPLAAFTVTQTGGYTALASPVDVGSPFSVRVAAVDAQGNIKTDWTGSVVLTSSAFAGTVSTSITSAGFKDSVSITPTIAGASQRIVATGGGVSTTQASGPFTVTPGPAAGMRISTQPIAGASGSLLATQPVIQLLDGYGNVVTTGSGASSTVTVTASGGTLGGTMSVTAVNGVATFTNLTFAGLVNTPYTLTFAVATPSLSVTSNQIQVTGPGPAVKLVRTTTSPISSGSGAVFATAPRIEIQDAVGNVVTSDSSSVVNVAITLPNSLNPSRESLLGSTSATAVNGVATFPGLGLNGIVGTSYTLTFGSGLLATASLVVNPTAGAAAGLAIVQNASDVAVGVAMSPAMTVRLVDTGGNAVASSGVVISAALATGSGLGTGTLTGLSATTDSTGLATFSTLRITGDPGTYRLTFSSSGLTSVSSSDFQLTQGTAAITFSPSSSIDFGAAPVQLTSTTTPAGLDVTYTTSTPTICSVTSTGVLTPLLVGTCKVTAATTTTTRYASASSPERSISVAAVPPGAPVITSVSAGDTTLTLTYVEPSFTGGATITSYTVVATPVSGSDPVVTKTNCSASGTPLTCTITGLVNGTDYTLTVAARNSAGLGPASSASPVRRPVTSPNAVTNLVATAGVGSITASWTPLTNAQLGGGTFTRYDVSYKLSTDSTWTSCDSTACSPYPLTSQSAGTTTISGLSAGLAYDIKVVAVTTANATELVSNTAEVRQTPFVVPSVPLNPTTAAGSPPTTAVFSWSAPASDGGPGLDSSTPYVVEATSSTPGATSPVTCTIASPTNRYCTAINLTSGATYEFRVRAANAVGLGPWTSPTTSYVVPSPDASLSALTATAGGTSATLIPTFSSSTTAYTVNVPYLSTTGSVTPTATEAGAIIRVNGVVVTSGTASSPVALAAGASTTVTIVVTAPDGVTTKTYTVTFNRADGPTKLAVATSPSAGASESVLPTQPVIEVQTSASALSTDSTAVVTVSTSGGALGCSGGGTSCLSVTASGGVATFTGLTFEGIVGTTYTLTFTSPGLTSTTATISPTGAGPATQLAFTTQPSASTVAGSAFARQPVVNVQDKLGNTVTTGSDATANIALTLTGGTGTLSGTATVAAVAGVATFSGLSIDKSGTNKVLTATATLNSISRTTTTSPQFAITPAAVSALVLEPVDASGVVDTTDLVAGEARLFRATLVDAYGNTVPTATGTVAFIQSAGSGSAVGLPAAGGTPSVVVVGGGVATLPVTGKLAGLVTASATFTPTGGSPGVSSTASVTVIPGAASQIALTASVSSLASGDPVTLTATIQDAAGNTVPSATGSTYEVSFLKSYGNGTITDVAATCAPGAACRVDPTSGVATLASSGVLVGSVSVVASVTIGGQVVTSPSVLIQVNPGAPAAIVLTATGLTSGTPDTLTSGSAASLIATVTDAQGNTVTSNTSTVTFEYASNTGTVTGLGTSAAVAGVATKSVTGALAGALAVRAKITVGGTTLTSSNLSFTVIPGAPASLTITTQPGGSTLYGNALTTQPVITVLDAQGNPVSSSGLTVLATVASGAGLNSGSVTSGTASTDSSGVATFSGLTVVGDGGDYELTFTVAGLPSVTSSLFTITKISQTITFTNPKPSGATYGDAAFTIAPTASSGLDPVVTSLTPSICQVSGANGWTVSIAAAGTCQLQASQIGNGQYAAATPVTQSFTIVKAAQAAVQIDSTNTVSFGGTINLIATGGSGTGSISFAVSSDSTCTVAQVGQAWVLTPGAAGSTCKVTATRAGDGNYDPASSPQQIITIAKADQVAAFTSTVPTDPLPGGTYTPTGTSTSTVTNASTGLSVAFTIASASSAVCSIDGSGLVTFIATGTCTIEANQAGNSDFNPAAQVTQVIQVGALNQTITFPQPANSSYGAASVLMTATASSGLAVSYAAGPGTTGFGTAGAACVVSPLGAVTIVDVGTCEVIASQVGNAQYAAASDVTRAFTIAPSVPGAPHITSLSAGDQSVTVGFTPPSFTGGAAITAYEVTAVPIGGGTTVVTSACSPSVTPLACTITGLVNGTAYTIKVAAINVAGTGPQATAAQSITAAAAPAAVTGATAQAGDTTVTVRWDPLTNPQLNGGTFVRYEVSYRPAAGGAYIPCPVDPSTYAPTTPCVAAGSGSGELNLQASDGITVTGLTNGVTYEFKIVAITTANGSELVGNTAIVTAFPRTVPTAPRNLTVLKTTPTTAQFSWTPPASDGGAALDATTPYTVTVTSTTPGAASPITCTVVGTQCEVTGLTAGAVYQFAIYATNVAGNSPTVTTSYSVPSADATLSSLTLGAGAPLNPVFNSMVTAYTATVPNSTTSTTVIPTATQANAVITVNGVTTTSGTASAALPLVVGENVITVEIVAEDGVTKTTYTITITRLPAPPPPPPPPAPAPEPAPEAAPLEDPGFSAPAANALMAGGGNLQVLVNGRPAPGVIVIPNRQSTGINVIGPDFGLDVWTLTTERRNIDLEDNTTLIAEVNGWIDVSARGYLSGTQLRAYLARRSNAPRGLQPGLRSGMSPAMDVIYLGQGQITNTGQLATSFPVPPGVNIGNYILQLNGITNDRQVRSANLPLKILPKRISRGLIRRGCLFAPNSAKLTRPCERFLRGAVQRIPKGANSLRVNIIGVSVGEPTRVRNRYLARKRARAVAFYLRAIGVRARITRTIVVSGKRARGPVASQSVVVYRGKPLTTVIFSFNR